LGTKDNSRDGSKLVDKHFSPTRSITGTMFVGLSSRSGIISLSYDGKGLIGRRRVGTVNFDSLQRSCR
jgi:hypothetical protein